MKVTKFVANEPDNMHCMQACYLMAMHTLLGKEMSMQEAELETNFVKEGTWEFAATLSFLKHGLKVISFDSSDWNIFAQKGVKAYLQSFIDDEKAIEDFAAITNPKEQELIKQILEYKGSQWSKEKPNKDSLTRIKELSKDHVVIMNINPRILKGEENLGIGHFVVFDNYENGIVTIQDPGLPGIENQQISEELFLKAWSFLGIENAQAMAISK